MTLAIRQFRNRKCQRAFTLVELVLVMVLLVVGISLVAPRLSSFVRGKAVDSEARRLLALTHAASSRAVSEGMTMVVWLDGKNNKYGLEQETPGKDGDSKAEVYEVDGNVQMIAKNATGSGTTFNNLPAIRFLADGTVDESSLDTVQLTGPNGGNLWLLESTDRRGYEISDSNKN